MPLREARAAVFQDWQQGISQILPYVDLGRLRNRSDLSLSVTRVTNIYCNYLVTESIEFIASFSAHSWSTSPALSIGLVSPPVQMLRTPEAGLTVSGWGSPIRLDLCALSSTLRSASAWRTAAALKGVEDRRTAHGIIGSSSRQLFSLYFAASHRRPPWMAIDGSLYDGVMLLVQMSRTPDSGPAARGWGAPIRLGMRSRSSTSSSGNIWWSAGARGGVSGWPSPCNTIGTVPLVFWTACRWRPLGRSAGPSSLVGGCPSVQLHRPDDVAREGRGYRERNRRSVAPPPGAVARATGPWWAVGSRANHVSRSSPPSSYLWRHQLMQLTALISSFWTLSGMGDLCSLGGHSWRSESRGPNQLGMISRPSSSPSAAQRTTTSGHLSTSSHYRCCSTRVSDKATWPSQHHSEILPWRRLNRGDSTCLYSRWPTLSGQTLTQNAESSQARDLRRLRSVAQRGGRLSMLAVSHNSADLSRNDSWNAIGMEYASYIRHVRRIQPLEIRCAPLARDGGFAAPVGPSSCTSARFPPVHRGRDLHTHARCPRAWDHPPDTCRWTQGGGTCRAHVQYCPCLVAWPSAFFACMSSELSCRGASVLLVDLLMTLAVGLCGRPLGLVVGFADALTDSGTVHTGLRPIVACRRVAGRRLAFSSQWKRLHTRINEIAAGRLACRAPLRSD